MSDNLFKTYKLDPLNNSYAVSDYVNKIDSLIAEWNRLINKPDTSEVKRQDYRDNIKAAEDHKKKVTDANYIKSERADAMVQIKADMSRYVLSITVVCIDDSRYINDGSKEDICKMTKATWPFINTKNVQNYLDLVNVKAVKSIDETPVNFSSLKKRLEKDHNGSIINWINYAKGKTELRFEGLVSLTDRSSFQDIKKDVDIISKRLLDINDLDKFKHVGGPALKEESQQITPIVVDEKTYREYCRYVDIQSRSAEFKTFIDNNSNSMNNPVIVNDLISKVNRSGCDTKSMIILLEDYCLKKKIGANFSSKGLNYVACGFCGGITPAGGNATKCGLCGKDLFIECPKCKKKIASTMEVCTFCGFKLKTAVENACINKEIFEENMKKGYPDLALLALEEIRNEYSSFPDLPSMESRYKKVGEPLVGLLKNMDEEERAKRYYALEQTCDAILRYAPECVRAQRLKETSGTAIANANAIIKKASSMDGESKRKQYISVANICSDHPDVLSFFKSSPPGAPVSINCRLDSKGTGVRIKIDPPKDYDESVKFTIVRKKDSVPNGPNDGEVVCEDHNTILFVDQKVLSGADLYYSVFSKRFGVYSATAASFGPMVILSDVINANASPIDGGIRISYTIPDGCGRVQIWKKEKTDFTGTSDGKIIYTGRESKYDDKNLNNGVTYYYRIVSEYSENRKTVTSGGVVVSCKPVFIPDPIDDLAVGYDNGMYEASWSGNSGCELFISSELLKLRGTVDVTELSMRRLDTVSTDVNHSKFSIPSNSFGYVYPVILMNNTAVVGNPVFVSSLPNVSNLKKADAVDSCALTFDWPNGCDKVVFCIRDSQFSEVPNDENAKITTITKQLYDSQKNAVISTRGMKHAYISIFSMYGDNYSNAKRVMAGNGMSVKVKYEIKKPFLGSLSLFLETDSSITTFPDFIVVMNGNNVPRSVKSGETLVEIRGLKLVKGKATIPLKNDIRIKDVKYRLFFLNNDDYDTFTLIHPR